MFGLRKKEPYNTVTCKGRKLDGHAAYALAVKDLDLIAMIKKADSVAEISRVSFGRIYQKPGTMLEENNIDDQGYNASFDKVTKSVAVNLRQGFMRQTLVFGTKEPQVVCAELSITLEVAGPSEPTVT